MGRGIGGDTLQGALTQGSELLYFLHKKLPGPVPFPHMPYGVHGQQDQEAHFTFGDPGKERTKHRAGGRLAQVYTTCKLELKSPDSQPRSMLLVLEDI